MVNSILGFGHWCYLEANNSLGHVDNGFSQKENKYIEGLRSNHYPLRQISTKHLFLSSPVNRGFVLKHWSKNTFYISYFKLLGTQDKEFFPSKSDVKPHYHTCPKVHWSIRGDIQTHFSNSASLSTSFSCISGPRWLLRYPGQSCSHPVILLINPVFLRAVACCVIRTCE